MATENSNQGLASLFAKIATISGKIGAIQKDATHAQNYKYHSADAIMGALNHLMSEHGLVIIPTAPRVTTENERYVIQYEFVLCDAETGETFAAKWAGEAPLGMQRKDGTISIDDKAMGKAHTYALKYWLLKLFMISTVDTDDLDTNDNSHASKPTSKPSPKPDFEDFVPDSTNPVLQAWDKDQMAKFWNKWHKKDKIEADTILAALSVAALGEFQGSLSDADKAMRLYIEKIK